MKIISLNVGMPRQVMWKGREVTTGIFKEPIDGPVMLRKFNLDGDRQADLENHGGWAKAVYAYPSEHYEPWRRELGATLSWGNFGENLTTSGLHETEVCIGDEFRIGDAVIKVTQPRVPCFKLALRLHRDDIQERFLASRRSGIYFTVLQEGLVNAGDSIEKISSAKECVTVDEVNCAYVREGNYIDLMRRAVQLEVLPNGLKGYFLRQIALHEEGRVPN